MAGTVDIANSAITRLGGKRILALSDDQKEAREINAIFTMRRDALLRSFNWNFAMERTTLSALVDAPSWGYTTAFQLPADCLRVVQVNDFWDIPGLMDYMNDYDTEPYKIEGRKIQTDISAPLKLRYVKRVVEPGDFDVCFTEVLSIDLAFHACEAITQSNTKKEGLREDKKEALLQAIRANAIELPPQNIPDDSWVMSRL